MSSQCLMRINIVFLHNMVLEEPSMDWPQFDLTVSSIAESTPILNDNVQFSVLFGIFRSCLFKIKFFEYVYILSY
jgi:hypothetical protein